MPTLRRHQLAYLSDAGWAAVQSRNWDGEAQACLAHWASHRLPLVVTRQPPACQDAEPLIGLGLPAPARWSRRRLALQVPRAVLLCFDEFPRAADVLALLPRHARLPWRALVAALAAERAPARVYGSYGWQHLTGLDHLHAGSDLDLWIAVSDADQANAVVRHLHAFAEQWPRLDGELVFADGAAVTWREWAAWRGGVVRSVLVKRLHGAALVHKALPQHKAGAAELAA